MLDGAYKTLLRLLPSSFDKKDRREMWDTFRRRIARTHAARGPSAATRERVLEVLDLALVVAKARVGPAQLDAGWQDLRFGMRSLRRRPLFTFIAVGTLSLGIGATTAIFSVVYGVLLRSPSYERPEELVSVRLTNPQWRERDILRDSWDRIVLSYSNFG